MNEKTEEKGRTDGEGAVDGFPWMIVIKVFRDGDRICALSGENLQDGIAGFGPSVSMALDNFVKSYRKARGTGVVPVSPVLIEPGEVPPAVELVPMRGHAGDCAVHAAPAAEIGECDCGYERYVLNAKVVGEAERLARFILAEYPDEIGAGDPVHGETAVDVAIRLLKSGGLCAKCGARIGGEDVED